MIKTYNTNSDGECVPCVVYTDVAEFARKFMDYRPIKSANEYAGDYNVFPFDIKETHFNRGFELDSLYIDEVEHERISFKDSSNKETSYVRQAASNIIWFVGKKEKVDGETYYVGFGDNIFATKGEAEFWANLYNNKRRIKK